MINVNLKDVLECKRMMNYNNAVIEYTTSLDGVFVNSQDMYYVIQNYHSNEFGYLQNIEDLVYLLEKHNCLSKSMLAYDHIVIADYMFDNNINIDMYIKLCEKVKCNKLKAFLSEAKDIICKYGVYVPEPRMKHYDRRKNNEKNLAETFDLNVLADAAYKLNVYEDNLYVDIANSMCLIVFNNDLENVRYNLNMLYDDYLSDYITDYDYDLMAYCCKVATYLLKHSDIGVYGIEVLTRGALEIALKDFDKNKYKAKERTSSVIEQIVDKASYGLCGDLDYNPNVKMTERKHLTDEEIEDFKRYM